MKTLKCLDIRLQVKTSWPSSCRRMCSSRSGGSASNVVLEVTLSFGETTGVLLGLYDEWIGYKKTLWID